MNDMDYIDVLRAALSLSPNDRLRLIGDIARSVRTVALQEQPPVKWSDLAGSLPYPAMGEDAQDWITGTRQESDAARERALKRQ